MAKLNGVFEKTDGSAIEYRGTRYEKTDDSARIGDIIMSIKHGYGFKPYGSCFDVVDKNGDVAFVCEEGDLLTFGPDDEGFAVYRLAEPVFRQLDTSSLSTAALIELKRIELARLEEQLAEESALKVGDYARVLIGGDELSSGDIVKILKVDEEDEDLPYRAALVIRDYCGDWIESAERITPAEARAALIAQIDALIPSP